MEYRKSGKVNVRNHLRRTKRKIVPVVHHRRGFPSTREKINEYSHIGLKPTPNRDLSYLELKKEYPTIEPRGDLDGDGVINKKDCKPLDKDQQHYAKPMSLFMRKKNLTKSISDMKAGKIYAREIIRNYEDQLKNIDNEINRDSEKLKMRKKLYSNK